MRKIALLLLLAACTTANPAATAATEELRAAGLTLAERGEVEQPFLAAKGRVYEVEGGELQLYTYPSEAAAQADAAKISPSGEVEGMRISWMAQPHFYRRGNTVAIFVGSGARTLETLQRVLGTPFAEKP